MSGSIVVSDPALASQNLKPMKLSSALGDALLFLDMTAREQLGRPFEFELEALSERSDIDALELLGSHVSVSLVLGDGSERHLDGLVAEFGPEGAADRGFFRYRLLLRPQLWLLTQRADTRIFQAQSVVDILHAVFDPLALDADFQLGGSYGPREYCVQYRESDFNFASRLMEEEGIYYFFKHEAGRHRMVLVDAASSHPNCPVQHAYRFVDSEHDDGTWDAVTRWTARRRIDSGQVTLTDHDWLQPSTSLAVTRKASDKARPAQLELYDWASHHKTVAEGERLAALRLQEAGARGQLADGEGPVRAMACGHRFTLDKHPQGGENAEYLAIATEMTMSTAAYYSGEGETTFACRFSAIPSAQPYRSERQATRRRVAGPQTALVVGPAGEEIYTDEHGRVKLHFFWDRLGKSDENSSCWVRVASPWAGNLRGWVSVPRIGDEVVVNFIDGDPDRPLVTGSVYNAANLPPWALPANKTQSGLLTRSSKGGTGQSNANVLRFEDKKGSEQVWLHAEKDQLIEVEHDEELEVGHDRHKQIGNDENVSVGSNRSESVGKDESISIGANRSESVGGNETISIGGSRSETVGKDESVSIGKDQSLSIGKSRDKTVGDSETVSVANNRAHTIGKDETLQVGDKRSVQIGKDDTLQVGKKWVVQAGDEISFVTGSASLTMKKDGTIQLKGKDITITGSGKIGIKAGSDVVIKGSKIAEN